MKFIKIQILFLCSLFVFSGCAYYNTFYNAKQFYKKAENKRKDREKTQVVELSPEEQERLRKSGMGRGGEVNKASTDEMQNYQRAIEKSSKVLEFYPTSKYIDDAIMLLGKCFFYRSEYSKALRKFEELISLYPKSEYISEAKLFMAKTYLGLEEYEEAENRLREYSLNKKNKNEFREEAKFELGGLYFDKGNYELAANHYRETAKESGDKLIKAMSIYRLGECMINLGDFAEAIKLFKRAVDASPNDDFNMQAYFKLGEAQSLNSEYKEAIQTFERLLSKEFEVKRIPRIKLQLANNLYLDNQVNDAIKWFENIIEEHPRTDASARSYFALGEFEEFIHQDYRLAREHYDMAKSQFASSAIVPQANQRATNIKLLLELSDEIARLEGREVISDSTAADGDGKKGDKRNERDDAPIDLGADGMWVNYSGRDRPPPRTLRDLTEEDLARAQMLNESQRAAISAADSTALSTMPAALDSAALAEQKAKEEGEKKLQLAQNQLALAELFFFNFDKVDSAMTIYDRVIKADIDTNLTARALYSLGYIYYHEKGDSSIGSQYLTDLIKLVPESEQAEGARKLLGIHTEAKIDSASMYYKRAEKSIIEDKDVESAFGYYDKIISDFPESNLVPRAIFAKGWHYETDLKEFEKAAQEYKVLLKDYPDSPFAKQVQKKMVAVEKIWKEEERKQKAIQDSINAVAKKDSLSNIALSDSTKKSLPDSLLSERPIRQAQAATHVDSAGILPNATIPDTTNPAKADTTTRPSREVAKSDSSTRKPAIEKPVEQIVRPTATQKVVPDTAATPTATPPKISPEGN